MSSLITALKGNNDPSIVGSMPTSKTALQRGPSEPSQKEGGSSCSMP
eukprot:CCRYP_017834-RA/>CCRYP_017834-RA protein AED:0.24 eAED:1.00 QI:0/-1/0/1/-1/0/1/0/46